MADSKVKQKNTKKNTVMDIETRMRIFANFLIDRIIEDQKNGIVKVNLSPQQDIQK